MATMDILHVYLTLVHSEERQNGLEFYLCIYLMEINFMVKKSFPSKKLLVKKSSVKEFLVKKSLVKNPQ